MGDNVGDVAGMGADLFESYVGAIISALTLGIIAYPNGGIEYALSSAFSRIQWLQLFFVFFVREIKSSTILKYGNISKLSNHYMILSYFLCNYFLGTHRPFFAILSGIVVGLIISKATKSIPRETINMRDHKRIRTGASANIP